MVGREPLNGKIIDFRRKKYYNLHIFCVYHLHSKVKARISVYCIIFSWLVLRLTLGLASLRLNMSTCFTKIVLLLPLFHNIIFKVLLEYNLAHFHLFCNGNTLLI